MQDEREETEIFHDEMFGKRKYLYDRWQRALVRLDNAGEYDGKDDVVFISDLDQSK